MSHRLRVRSFEERLPLIIILFIGLVIFPFNIYSQSSKSTALLALGSDRVAENIVNILNAFDSADDVYDAVAKLDGESRKKIVMYYEVGRSKDIDPLRFRRGIRAAILGLYEQQRYPIDIFLADYTEFKRNGTLPEKPLPSALTYLNLAIRSNPSSEEIFSETIARYSKINGNIDEIEDAKQQQVTLYSKNGAAKFKNKEYAEAIKYFQIVLRLRPTTNNKENLAIAYRSLAKVQIENENNPKAAVDNFKMAAELFPDNHAYQRDLMKSKLELATREGRHNDELAISRAIADMDFKIFSASTSANKDEAKWNFIGSWMNACNILIRNGKGIINQLYGYYSKESSLNADDKYRFWINELNRYERLSPLKSFDPRKPNKYKVTDIEKLANDKINEGISFCERVVNIDNTIIWPLISIADGKVITGDFDQAIRLYNKSMNLAVDSYKKENGGDWYYYLKGILGLAETQALQGKCGEFNSSIDKFNNSISNTKKKTENINLLAINAQLMVCPHPYVEAKNILYKMY